MPVRAFILSVVLFVVLYGLYLAADIWLRRDTARRLSQRHDAGEGGGLNREDFIDKGLAEYERSTEKKLLLGIFVIPFAVIGLLALLAK
ncbi:MAG: hypothetical protein AAF074_09235 [Pseudomonadota bacterium]